MSHTRFKWSLAVRWKVERHSVTDGAGGVARLGSKPIYLGIYWG